MPEAKVKWVDGMRFVGHADSKHGIVMDAGDASGGEDTGIRPAELVLISVGGCTAMDVVFILRKMKVAFEDVEVVVNGQWSPEHPKYWSRIELKYIVKGTNIPEEKVKKAIELSQEKYCSVSETLRRCVEVSHTYEIRQGQA